MLSLRLAALLSSVVSRDEVADALELGRQDHRDPADLVWREVGPLPQDEILREAHRLHRHLPFVTGRVRDAAGLLEPALPSRDSIRGAHARDVVWAAPALGEFHRLRTGGAWLAHPELASAVDTGLLGRLLAYDHWNLRAEGWPPSLEADINLVPLQAVAKARLVDGLYDGELLRALVEVRHLASLCWSTDDYAAGYISLKMLDDEALAYEAGVRAGALPADAWHPVPQEDRGALRHLLLTLPAAFERHGDAAFGRRLVGDLQVPGPCATLDQQVRYEAPFRNLGPDAHEDLLAAALDAAQCALPVARAIWDHPEWSVQYRSRGPARLATEAALRFPVLGDVIVDILAGPPRFRG